MFQGDYVEYVGISLLVVGLGSRGFREIERRGGEMRVFRTCRAMICGCMVVDVWKR